MMAAHKHIPDKVVGAPESQFPFARKTKASTPSTSTTFSMNQVMPVLDNHSITATSQTTEGSSSECTRSHSSTAPSMCELGNKLSAPTVEPTEKEESDDSGEAEGVTQSSVENPAGGM